MAKNIEIEAQTIGLLLACIDTDTSAFLEWRRRAANEATEHPADSPTRAEIAKEIAGYDDCIERNRAAKELLTGITIGSTIRVVAPKV